MTKTRHLSKEGPVESRVISARELEYQRWGALGNKHGLFARLVPRLRKAVEAYHRTESTTDSERARHHRQLDRQALAAEAIRKQADSLIRVLEKSQQSVRDGLSAGHLPRSYGFLPATTGSRRKPRSLADLLGSWDAADTAVEVVGQLAAEAKEWERVARMQARRRPGRDSGIRRHLARWVGYQLAREGITLTTTKSGCWARVLAVMNRAVGLGVEPYQFRDLESELKRLRRDYPHLVGSFRLQNPRPKKMPNV